MVPAPATTLVYKTVGSTHVGVAPALRLVTATTIAMQEQVDGAMAVHALSRGLWGKLVQPPPSVCRGIV